MEAAARDGTVSAGCYVFSGVDISEVPTSQNTCTVVPFTAHIIDSCCSEGLSHFRWEEGDWQETGTHRCCNGPLGDLKHKDIAVHVFCTSNFN